MSEQITQQQQIAHPVPDVLLEAAIIQYLCECRNDGIDADKLKALYRHYEAKHRPGHRHVASLDKILQEQKALTEMYEQQAE